MSFNNDISPPHPFRRSSTLPTRFQRSSSATVSTSRPTSANEQTLFSHSHVKIARFPAPSFGSPNSAAESLPWTKPNEHTIAVGAFRLYRKHESAAFIESGNVLLSLLPRSQCWCVDGVSKFAMRLKQDIYRVELPYDNDQDKACVEDFIAALGNVLMYERTPCPFKRGFHVDTADEPVSPLPVKRLTRSNSKARKWSYNEGWRPEGAEKPTPPDWRRALSNQRPASSISPAESEDDSGLSERNSNETLSTRPTSMSIAESEPYVVSQVKRLESARPVTAPSKFVISEADPFVAGELSELTYDEEPRSKFAAANVSTQTLPGASENIARLEFEKSQRGAERAASASAQVHRHEEHSPTPRTNSVVATDSEWGTQEQPQQAEDVPKSDIARPTSFDAKLPVSEQSHTISEEHGLESMDGLNQSQGMSNAHETEFNHPSFPNVSTKALPDSTWETIFDHTYSAEVASDKKILKEHRGGNIPGWTTESDLPSDEYQLEQSLVSNPHHDQGTVPPDVSQTHLAPITKDPQADESLTNWTGATALEAHFNADSDTLLATSVQPSPIRNPQSTTQTSSPTSTRGLQPSETAADEPPTTASAEKLLLQSNEAGPTISPHPNSTSSRTVHFQIATNTSASQSTTKVQNANPLPSNQQHLRPRPSQTLRTFRASRRAVSSPATISSTYDTSLPAYLRDDSRLPVVALDANRGLMSGALSMLMGPPSGLVNAVWKTASWVANSGILAASLDDVVPTRKREGWVPGGWVGDEGDVVSTTASDEDDDSDDHSDGSLDVRMTARRREDI